MILKILIGIAVVLGALAVFVATRPSEFAVTRSATFAAPAPAVFQQVNELRKWEAWSPWAKKDPNAKSTYAGPAAGKDASMAWAGNNEVGEGRMTIVESKASELVRFKLEFFRPFAATNEAVFAFKGEGDKTSLTWTMTGKNNFIAKAMCLVFDMDKMVGGDFEKGLAGIKAIVEAKK
jgi:hypothetical protein